MTVSTTKRLRAQAETAADQFDSTLLSNRVYEQVQGHHGHSDLRQTIDLAEAAYDLADAREETFSLEDGVGANVFDAAETLNDQVDRLVTEEIARACKVIVREADGWTDAWDVSEVNEATREAMQWLGEHTAVAERVGAGGVVGA